MIKLADPHIGEREALEAARLMLKLVSRHFSESGSALHDDGNCPRCADEDRAEDAILAYGRAVREADKETARGPLDELRIMVQNTASWNHIGFRRIWTSKLNAAISAIEALEEKS